MSPNVVAICPHTGNDPMTTSMAAGFKADRPSSGTPAFYIGDTKTSSNDSESAVTTLMGQVPEAGLDILATNNGTVMNVKLQAKFFAASNGTFYVNVYILEDNIDGSSSAGEYAQSGKDDPEFKHMYTLRESATGDAYGEIIAEGSIASGATYDKEYNINLDPSWVGDNLNVAAVIWNYDASVSPQYMFVNAIQK